MTEIHGLTSPAAIQTRPRKIVRRTRGNHHGPVTRLMSPGDLGQVLKPFVFLDLFEMDNASFSGTGLHPHSGIATVTYLFEGSVRYEDTSGATGVLLAGGVEWFKAGHGAWHGGGPGDTGRARGFQLWLALPPGLAELPGGALASWRVLALPAGHRPYGWLGLAEHGMHSCP
jgi:redox-sensitive bicupin YhaK (pirin superfamily)